MNRMKLHHIGVEVESLDRAKEFYVKLFQMEEEHQLRFMDESILFLKNNDLRIELVENNQASGEYHICFQVENLATWLQHVPSSSMEGPYKLDNGWVTVFFQGPNGEMIEFLETNDNNR